jgi:DNA-binding response OmpR family regulator
MVGRTIAWRNLSGFTNWRRGFARCFRVAGKVQVALSSLAIWFLDRTEFRVERAGRTIDLTAKEFGLLEYLMRNARRTVNRAMIMENVWKATYDAKSNLVDVYVNYVRDKIDTVDSAKLIRTFAA